jgi:hypothetical protein
LCRVDIKMGKCTAECRQFCCLYTRNRSYLDHLPAPYTLCIDAAVGILYCCTVYVQGRSTAHYLHAMLHFTCGTGKEAVSVRSKVALHDTVA